MCRKPLCLAAVAIVVGAVPAAADWTLRLEDPDQYELQAVGFELDRGGTVAVEATGLRLRHQDDLSVYAWVLDAATREVVWDMDRRDTDRVRGSRVLRETSGELELPGGRYELYLYSGRSWGGDLHIEGLRDLWDAWRDHDDDEDWYEEERADCFVELRGGGSMNRFEVDGGLEDALIRFNRVGDSELLSQGFQLDKTMALHIYSLIEYPKGDRSAADYAWVVNAEDREVVWQTRRRNTRRAGGGDKNRVHNRDVTFDAGRYILYYGTDDSHSWEEFNVNPPFDPVNWGVTVSPGEGFDKGAFKTFDADDRGEEIMAFTSARDHDFFQQAFRMKKDGTVHVYALGEMGDDGEYYDYAWITRASGGGMIWEMTRRNSMPAGGASKNRMFDGQVNLEAGDYMLYYVTDDSHSFEEWNAAAPFDERAWGVQVFTTDATGKGDVELVSLDDLAEEAGVLAQIIRVGDDERRRQRFTLDKDTRVHVYCLGEGTGGDMYDYGYILDDRSGRVVWEMRYRQTDHAGGARKNRVFDDDISLDAGEYEVVYVTDGSHSFEDWNDRKPHDPLGWGITIRKAD